MITTVQLDQGVMKELALGACGVAEAVEAKGEEGKVIAIGLSAEFRKSGDYQDSFDVHTEVVEFSRISPRITAILENTSDHALDVEWGSKHYPEPQHVLKRTADALAGG